MAKLAFRAFLVDDVDVVTRFPIAKWNALSNGTLRMPEKANQRIRYMLLVLHAEDRRLVAVHTLNTGYFPFDKNGALDEEA